MSLSHERKRAMISRVERRIVLTGGPCAGKTTLAQLIERAYQNSIVAVPEAASLLFSGGFPRFDPLEAQRSIQRAIFRVQHELESAFAAEYPDRLFVLDRGSVDGAAYWPEGPDAFFQTMNSSLEDEFQRYDRVIYLESAAEADYFRHKARNPNRKEDWAQAKKLDDETFRLWSKHPHFTLINNNRSFERKVLEVISVVSDSLSFFAGGEKK